MLLRNQRIIVSLTALGCAAIIAVLIGWASVPVQPPALAPPSRSAFDARTAMADTRWFATNHLHRVTGSPGARRAADALAAAFTALGYRVERYPFEMWLGGRRVRGADVVAVWPGAMPESIAILAHADAPTTSPQAAADDAAGIGVLLELARVMRDAPHRRTLIFAATDAEEWGMIGARELAHRLRDQGVAAAISIDDVKAGDALGLELTCSGQSGGYAPLWLRELLVAAGAANGTPVSQPSGLQEWIDRALEVSLQDQGPLLRAGIPAVNVLTIPADRAAARARYHTPADVFRGFEPRTFAMVGGTVERAIAALDAMPANQAIPARGAGGAGAFLIRPGRYVPALAMRSALLLALVPFALAALLALRNLTGSAQPSRWLHLLAPGIWVIPPYLCVLTLYALTAANVLPRYELYPATPRDPFLYHVSPTVAVPLAAVLVAAIVAVAWTRRRLPLGRSSFATRKTALYVWIFAAMAVALAVNAYGAWLMLGVLLLTALLVVRPAGPGGRGVNALLLLAAPAPFAALAYLFAQEIYLGWRISWYLVLQAAYGAWSPLAVGLALLAVALWAQALWTFVVRGRIRA
ncbi:MAG TPA: M28 family peptidase [Candidatus Dormibacteraeota bacterium]|nr:M28 family peptidase [Candidatus Dormibacteraeota bacterium]